MPLRFFFPYFSQVFYRSSVFLFKTPDLFASVLSRMLEETLPEHTSELQTTKNFMQNENTVRFFCTLIHLGHKNLYVKSGINLSHSLTLKMAFHGDWGKNNKVGRGELSFVCLPAFRKSLQHLDASLKRITTHLHFSSFHHICKDWNIHNFSIVDNKHQNCSEIKNFGYGFMDFIFLGE